MKLLIALFVTLFVGASLATYSNDGSGNNVMNPTWGAVDSALVSEFGSHYPGDGSGITNLTYDRPSCCFLEPFFTAVFDTAGLDNLNQAQVIFGQFVASHDTALSPGNASEAIPNEACLSGHKRKISFPTNPRTHPNKVTSYVELTVVYGESDVKAAALRSYVNGELLHSFDKNLLPKRCADLGINIDAGGADPNNVFCGGDVRTNENLYLLVLHNLFMREHNRLAKKVHQKHHKWSDELIYQKARAMNIAAYQQIVQYEWIPTIVGQSFFDASALSSYQGYDSAVNAGYFADSSQSVFRVPHGQIVNEMLREDDSGHVFSDHSLITTGFSPGRLEAYGMEQWLRGMGQTIASPVGTFFPSELNTFPNPFIPDLHLMAVDCFRSRDFGLIDFNGLRVQLGLPAYTMMSQISKVGLNQMILGQYNDINNIDEFIGLCLEDHAVDSPVGETMQRAIERQYLKTRAGDRFWFENPTYTDLNAAEKMDAYETTLAHVILNNSDLKCVQKDFFKMPWVSDILCKVGNTFITKKQ